MRKAISEIVVAVMFLMIVVTLVGVVYVFIGGFQEQAKSEVQQSGTEAFKKLGSCLQIVSFDDKTNNIWVKNCGRYPIENVSVFVDDVFTVSRAVDLKPNEIKNVTISPSIWGVHKTRIEGAYTSAFTSINMTTGNWCSDGTSYGQCSATKPKYCNSGVFINKCSVCGCSGGGTCQADESCTGGFDFSFSASPSSGSVAQGSSANAAVTATLTSGATQSVSLSCSGLPSGASCSFIPTSITPTASSTLTISTLGTTPTGTYPITVSGTGGGVTRTAPYSLTVNPATIWFDPAWNYRKSITITGSSSALTDYQIPINLTTALYNNTGLVGSWHFTNNDTSDSSGYGNNGVQYGGVNCTVTGKFGTGCSFDGVNDYVDAGTGSSLNIDIVTVEVWVKTTSTTASRIVAKADSSNQYGYKIYMNANGKVSFLTASTTTSQIDGNIAINDGSWHQVVGMKENTNSDLAIYIDGVPDTQGTVTNKNMIGSAMLAIGREGATNALYFNGTIDEVRIYNRALNATEIAEHYQAGKARLDYQDLRFTGNFTVYETPVAISGAGSALADYQVPVSITNPTMLSHMRADGGDMRFFSAQTSSPYASQGLPYWIESINSTLAKVWVKITSIPAGGTTIYMYYGNPSASSASNGTNTFILFDDFSGSTLDTTKWGQGTTSNAVVANGIMTYTSNSDQWLLSSNNYAPPMVLRARNKVYTGGNVYWGWQKNPYSSPYWIIIECMGGCGAGTRVEIGDGGGTPGIISTNWAPDVYSTKEIRWDYTNSIVKWSENGIENLGSPYTTQANIPPVSLAIMPARTQYDAKVDTDWILLRKYASPEPTATIGSESVKSQNNEASLNYWLESDNTAWVKVPSIPAGGTKIYMYYGNPSAPPASNGTNTFDVFDDFNDNSLSANWVRFTTGEEAAGGRSSVDATEANQRFEYYGGATRAGGYYYNRIVGGNSIIEANAGFTGDVHWLDIFFGFYLSSNDHHMDKWGIWGGSCTIGSWHGSGYDQKNAGTGAADNSALLVPHYTSTVNIKTYLESGYANQRINIWDGNPSQWGTESSPYTWSHAVPPAITSNQASLKPAIGFSTNNNGCTFTFWLDDIRVRKYASPEPSASIGAEEAK